SWSGSVTTVKRLRSELPLRRHALATCSQARAAGQLVANGRASGTRSTCDARPNGEAAQSAVLGRHSCPLASGSNEPNRRSDWCSQSKRVLPSSAEPPVTLCTQSAAHSPGPVQFASSWPREFPYEHSQWHSNSRWSLLLNSCVCTHSFTKRHQRTG